MLKIYSATWCTYCNKLKTYLESKGIDFINIDIDEKVDEAMFLVSEGLETIPQVFKDGVHLGGCDETIAKLDNNLK